jgi:hypothetical protein
MQIREITSVNEGLGWDITKGIGRAARDQFIQKATGLSDPYQTTELPNAAATTAGTTATTVTPPAPATTPLSSRVAGAKARAASAARKGNPTVNTSAAPVVYRFDGRALDPQNPNDARIIKTLQAAGVTSATS